jgi:hypothetical protein
VQPRSSAALDRVSASRQMSALPDRGLTSLAITYGHLTLDKLRPWRLVLLIAELIFSVAPPPAVRPGRSRCAIHGGGDRCCRPAGITAHGTFTLTGRIVRLPTARGCAPLLMRLDRPVPYPPPTIRAVTLLSIDGRLHL